MLSNATYETAIPCNDFERAKSFYAEQLSLTPSSEQSDAAFYTSSDGTQFLLFPSGGSASGTHSQMAFVVADIDAEVRDLRQRGVKFEEYDFPGFDKATSIAHLGEHRGAWFKDSEGSLLGVVQER